MLIDDGAIGAAVGAINIALDEVRSIANGTVDLGATDASDAETKFAGALISSGSFGEVEQSAVLGAQQGEVHDVFHDTIKGVMQDLTAFRDTLLECAKNHQATDEQTQVALTALGHRMSNHQWRSNRDYQQSVHAHGGTVPQSHPGGGSSTDGSTTSPDSGGSSAGPSGGDSTGSSGGDSGSGGAPSSGGRTTT